MLVPSRPANATVATSIINKHWCQVDPPTPWSWPLLINVYVNIQSTIQSTRPGLGRHHLAFAVANCLLNRRFATATGWKLRRLLEAAVVVAQQYATFVFFNAMLWCWICWERTNLSVVKPYLFVTICGCLADLLCYLWCILLSRVVLYIFWAQFFVCLETIDIGPDFCCNLAGHNCWLLTWSFACWGCWIFAADTQGAHAG